MGHYESEPDRKSDCRKVTCMLMLVSMTIDFNAPQRLSAALDDETLVAQRAMVRGQLVGYLSGLWQYSSEELESGKDHVRWAELQLRIIDRLMKLWRLDVVTAAAPEEVEAGEEQERIRKLVTLAMDDMAETGEAG
jgi:hypothetical protein